MLLQWKPLVLSLIHISFQDAETKERNKVKNAICTTFDSFKWAVANTCLLYTSQYDLQLEYAKGDIALLGETNPQNDEYAKNQLARIQEESKRATEAAKLQLERQKIAIDVYKRQDERSCY